MGLCACVLVASVAGNANAPWAAGGRHDGGGPHGLDEPSGWLAWTDRERERLRAQGLTGVLLHHDGAIIQCAEGQPTPVDTWLAGVRGQGAWRGLHVLMHQASERRCFTDWLAATAPWDGSPALRRQREAWEAVLAGFGDGAADPLPVLLLRDFWSRVQRHPQPW